MPELREFAWPLRNTKAIRSSLAAHSAYLKEVPEPPWRQVMPAMVKSFADSASRLPDCFTSEGLLITQPLFDQLCKSLNHKANPGLPLCALAKSKGDLMELCPNFVMDLFIERLRKLSSADLSDETPLWLVQNGFCDPVRVFIKNEPHKVTKIMEGRSRLISNVGVVDELIDRLLSMHQIEQEISRYQTIPAKAGLGFTDEMSQALWAITTAECPEPASSDVKAWDWHFAKWMYDACVDLDITLCENPTVLWERLLRNRAYCSAWKVFVDPSGCMFAQLTPGIQASGSYRTTSWNSKARVCCAYLIGATWAMSMGDDAAEEAVEGAVDRYAAIGVTVTDYVSSAELRKATGAEFEFCSHLFFRDRAVPLNWVKGLFRLLQQAPNEHLLSQWRYERRHDPRMAQCADLISRVWLGPDKHGTQQEEQEQESDEQ